MDTYGGTFQVMMLCEVSGILSMFLNSVPPF